VKTLAIAVALALTPAGVSAHAFPDHSEPRVGYSVEAPRSVRIWFDGAIEPVFSTIRVEDGDKRRVDAGDARCRHEGQQAPRGQPAGAAPWPLQGLLERGRA
jgi:methionine-rich copper-binding protein CopC